MITVELERTLTKDEILEKYLNVVEFGDHLYGIKPAARFYFQKSPAELTPAEGAFLAFLLPNPKKYSQSFRQKKLTKFAGRQVRVIVDRLYHFKKIGEDEYASARAEVDRLFGPDVTGPAPEPTLDNEPTIDEDGDETPPVIAYPAGLEPMTTTDD
jgi:monofunctional biosynthetic peptidoglycan transglycosylase